MKKRVFCILLAVMLSFGLLALAANADGEEREIHLIFDLDGGFVKEGYTLPTSYIFGENIPFPTSADVYKPGHRLTGWTYVPTGPGVSTYKAKWSAIKYYVSFDTQGGTQIPEKTLYYSDKVLEGVADPTREGFEFKGWRFKDTFVTADTKFGDLETDGWLQIKLVAVWRDLVAPEGKITLRGYNWIDFTTPLTYEWYCSETQTVTVTAYDNGTVMMIGYIISSQDMSVADMENAVYASYEEPIVLDEDGEYIIYVMIVDGGMNIRYLRSDRIIIDKTAPVINGIEDGRIYCSGQTFTVTEEYLYGVFVNNEEIKPENGVYTLPFGKNSIVVYDEAGNRTTADVTVYDGHTPGLNLGDCTIPIYCVYCSEVVTAAKQHDFSGEWLSDENGHWHKCQNAGCEAVDTKEAHVGADDGDCTTAINCTVCGYEIKAALNHDFSGEWLSDENGHWHKCQNAGCEAVDTKEAHVGADDGDCTTAINCTVCGYEIKAALNHDFSGEWLSDENGHWHECQNADCEITDAAVAHAPDEKGIRADGEKHWHECVCGVRLDEDAHTFEWIVDREATEDETGEKHEECSVCGTKRSEGTEIPKKEKTPSTSDPANLGVWVAVATLSSLCLAGLIVFKKKKAF